MKRTGLSIWRQVIGFHLSNPHLVLPLLPFLLLPFFGDILYTVLIREQQKQQPVSLLHCLLTAAKSVPELLMLKIAFGMAGAVWSFIPIVGWYKSYRFGICWSMAANVLIYEKGMVPDAFDRCRELADRVPSLGMSTMLRIPFLFMVFLIIFLAVGAHVYDTKGTFYAYGIALYMLIPGLGAANTFLYLALTEPVSVSLASSQEPVTKPAF